MASTRTPEATTVVKLSEVGRYALGVQWGDQHDSILPYRNLRRACPCDTCLDAPPTAPIPPEAERPVRVELLGTSSIFLGWGDSHETIFLLEELRELCRCARCAGEPEYPISGS